MVFLAKSFFEGKTGTGEKGLDYFHYFESYGKSEDLK